MCTLVHSGIINTEMMKSTMIPADQEKLDILVVQLNDLNAEIKYLKSCHDLTMRQKIAKMACAMRKRSLLKKLQTLIKNHKRIP
ncbi:GfV-B56-ORF1 [Ichnoviriform fumiferanae]|uniref:GfV-B56-ORF1 n=1 Tax=Ichnoviriform fumiferanae TaxID=419435 RepID=A2PZV3_9VIRU|nr:GfV-B56-ORF1 [Ichnoviriform fumiferanae]BAF45525.1 GfV-B56-ORF1 [Ichnoviriform fumiferanae]